MPLSPSYMQIWQENVCHVFRITPSESPTLHITLNLVSALHFGITLFWQLLYLFCFCRFAKSAFLIQGKSAPPLPFPLSEWSPAEQIFGSLDRVNILFFKIFKKFYFFAFFAGYLRRATFQIRHRLCQVFLVNFCSPGFSVWWHLSIPIPC